MQTFTLLLLALVALSGCTAMDNRAKAHNARLVANAAHNDPLSRSPSLKNLSPYTSHAAYMAAQGRAAELSDTADAPLASEPDGLIPDEYLSHDEWLAAKGLSDRFPRPTHDPIYAYRPVTPTWTPPPWYAGYSFWNSLGRALIGSYRTRTKIYADGTKWRTVGPFGTTRGKIYGDGTKIRID